MTKDTLRILVGWTCNMRCPYCCNQQERFRRQIFPVEMDWIDFMPYQTVCITGGEPRFT